MNRIALLTLVLALLTAVIPAKADDEAQTELRLNPHIEESRSLAREHYPFLRLDANKIEMNGADWSSLRNRFATARDSGELFSVVYLGDSHVQADFGGAVLRSRLAKEASSAGRGLVIPFKLAGTNQPADYGIRLHSAYLSAKLLKMPWAVEMPFTGIGIQPATAKARFEISAEEPFGLVRLHFRGKIPSVSDTRDLALNRGVEYEYADSTIVLSRPTHRLLIEFDEADKTIFGGFELLNGNGGILTHSIGNNGATYSSYANIDRFGPQIETLGADLVVVALGTNEAFGNTSEETLENDIDNLLGAMRRHNPKVNFLLVAPTECFRRTYRRRKGKRRAVGTTVNVKAARMRAVIKRYAQENGIPFYDTYAVAGGTGSAAKMKTAKILGNDGIHFTAGGYRLWGSLLADAIIEELENERANQQPAE